MISKDRIFRFFEWALGWISYWNRHLVPKLGLSKSTWSLVHMNRSYHEHNLTRNSLEHMIPTWKLIKFCSLDLYHMVPYDYTFPDKEPSLELHYWVQKYHSLTRKSFQNVYFRVYNLIFLVLLRTLTSVYFEPICSKICLVSAHLLGLAPFSVSDPHVVSRDLIFLKHHMTCHMIPITKIRFIFEHIKYI